MRKHIYVTWITQLIFEMEKDGIIEKMELLEIEKRDFCGRN